jgi:hypothetical protein
MARLGRLAMEALARQSQFSESQRRTVVEAVVQYAALEPRAVGRGVAVVETGLVQVRTQRIMGLVEEPAAETVHRAWVVTGFRVLFWSK